MPAMAFDSPKHLQRAAAPLDTDAGTGRRAFLQATGRLALGGLAALAAVLPAAVRSQQPPPAAPPAPVTRLRGTIESISATQLVLRERGGQTIELALAANLTVIEVYPVSLADIQPGSFVGVGAMPQQDGSQRAIAVTLFPEAMRGTGEGHRPFDFLPQSTMTNATVAGVAAAADGRSLRLQYKGGEQLIVVPPAVPVVSLRPGSRDLLVPGAAVALNAQSIEGQPTALRISAGRNGFAPPY